MDVLKVFFLFLSGRSGDDVSLSDQVFRGGIGKREKTIVPFKKDQSQSRDRKKNYLLKKVNLNVFL